MTKLFINSTPSGTGARPEYGECHSIDAMNDGTPSRMPVYGLPPLCDLANHSNPPPSGDGVVVADALVGWLTGDNSHNEILRSRLIKAILARKELGISRYGTPLRANNGRLTIADLAQELLDAAVYAQQGAIEYSGVDSDISDFFNEARFVVIRRLAMLDALLSKKTTAHWELPGVIKDLAE